MHDKIGSALSLQIAAGGETAIKCATRCTSQKLLAIGLR
jgi:hypothetical protein